MMTMRKYISILLLFLCTVGTQAQKTVSGRVLNQDSVALQQATVLLYLVNDSTPLRVVSTDQWGMFRFQADTARYVLQVLHMGYVPYEHALSVRGADQQTYIGDILLKESVKSLGEVSVSGEVHGGPDGRRQGGLHPVQPGQAECCFGVYGPGRCAWNRCKSDQQRCFRTGHRRGDADHGQQHPAR